MIEPSLYPPPAFPKKACFGNVRVGMKPFLLKYPAVACASLASCVQQTQRTSVISVLNRLRAAPSSLSLGPATVYDGLAVGFQQPVPRHRHYNYSVHREPEFSSFSGRPSCKGDVDIAVQVRLKQFCPYRYW